MEKLRKFFVKRGIVASATALTAMIAANSVQAAPTTLAKAATTAVLTKGTATSLSTLTLIKGTLKLMAWTKAKTAIAIGVAILLAGGTTTIVVQRMVSPSIDESLWKADLRVFRTVPPVLIIRPARVDRLADSSFGSNGKVMRLNATGISNGEKAMRLNATVPELLSVAYSIPVSKIVLPDGLPQDHFDLMLTLDDHPKAALQAEIKKRFGLLAHRETRDEDALVLKVKNVNASGISRSTGENPGSTTFITQSESSLGVLPPNISIKINSASRGSSSDQTTMNNQKMADFAAYLEKQFGKTVVDQTGTTNRFNFKFQVQAQAGESRENALKRSLLDQLGLELVPSRESIEMLVVEKLK